MFSQSKDNCGLLDCGQADLHARNEINSSRSIIGDEFSNAILFNFTIYYGLLYHVGFLAEQKRMFYSVS